MCGSGRWHSGSGRAMYWWQVVCVAGRETKGGGVCVVGSQEEPQQGRVGGVAVQGVLGEWKEWG